jgi:hypothetical protein
MRVTGLRNVRASAWISTAILLASTTVAADVVWDGKVSALWVRNGQAVDLHGVRTSDDIADLRLEGRQFTGVGCVMAAVSGGAEDFATLTVPDDGYAERLAIEGTQLAIARCGATYAKLLIEAATYNPDAESPNAAGLTLSYVLSTETR